MSERKVLTKYYPPDFDPASLQRKRGPKQAGPKVQTVRLMSPFSMKCTSCGEYVYKGRKFNARKETPLDERYLGIQIFRFYIRCPRCSGEIIFSTSPKTQDYVCEKGAKRNTDPWKRGLGEDPTANETVDERLDRLEREMGDADEMAERNAMAELEAKTEDAKREMAVADALDELRSRNARIEKAHRDGAGLLDDDADAGASAAQAEERARQEREDEEAARRAFAFARELEALEEPMDENEDGWTTEESSTAGSVALSAAPTAALPVKEMPPPSFKRQVKKKKDHAALLGIKKKPSLV